MKTRSIRFEAPGGPEVLKLVEIDLPELGPGEARIRNEAVALNYIDTYHRSGLYPLPLPSGLGSEAAGIVEAVGAGVTALKPGDRVAYSSGPAGAYAEAHNIVAGTAIKLPANVTTAMGAAVLSKGLTAQYLLRQTFRVEAGQTILFHAAAGGVGLIACQWAKHLGATVIGTVGSDDKAAIARANGCDHVINYRTENVVERVKEITSGAKLPVVYDGVGKDTYVTSLDCLRLRGLLVSFGNASGAVTGVDLITLMLKGSVYVTRPALFHYATSPEELHAMAVELFDVVASGAVKVTIGQTYKLADAAQAHTDLQARKTTGSTILIP